MQEVMHLLKMYDEFVKEKLFKTVCSSFYVCNLGFYFIYLFLKSLEVPMAKCFRC